MASGGLLFGEIFGDEYAGKEIDKSKMALLVKHAGEYGKHAAAKKAGFQKDDILVSVDGISKRMSESELIGRLLDKHQPGEKVPATVLRGKERVELSLPIQ